MEYQIVQMILKLGFVPGFVFPSGQKPHKRVQLVDLAKHTFEAF